MTELKIPLTERALDELTLATDAAVVPYQEQRLKLQTARKVSENRQQADVAHTRADEDDGIA